jgi:hypothetical protein
MIHGVIGEKVHLLDAMFQMLVVCVYVLFMRSNTGLNVQA